MTIRKDFDRAVEPIEPGDVLINVYMYMSTHHDTLQSLFERVVMSFLPRGKCAGAPPEEVSAAFVIEAGVIVYDNSEEPNIDPRDRCQLVALKVISTSGPGIALLWVDIS